MGFKARRSPQELSPQERSVMRLAAEGYSSREMAEQLDISVKTVEGYRSRAMKKLNLRGRVQLVSWAFEEERRIRRELVKLIQKLVERMG